MTEAVVDAAETDHPRAAELREFLDLHYRRVVGAVGLISGNRDMAEDAVQEAIVRAWNRRDEPVERLAGWITVVAVNQVRADLRRAGSEQRAADRLGRRDDAPSAHVDLAPADEELWIALRSLPEREREAAVLFYVHDISVDDTAKAMDVSSGTVKTLLSRARAHLAGALGADGSDS